MGEKIKDQKKMHERLHEELDSAIAKIDALSIAVRCQDATIEEATSNILLCEVRYSLDQIHDIADRLGML